MSRFTGVLTLAEVDVDSHVWRLCEPLTWEVDALGSGKLITVPAGFRTDGASFPWPVSIALNRWGRWRRAAALHDYLYELLRHGTPHTFATTRKDADKEFRDAMLASGVFRLTAAVFWLAVRLFGGRAV